MADTLSDLDAFHAALRSPEGYATPQGGRPWPPKHPRGALLSLRFHLGCLVRCALRGGTAAMRGKLTPQTWAFTGFRMMRDMERLGARCRFEGFSRLGGDSRPRVYVANHTSLVETIILPPALMAFGEVAVVAKKSLANYPFFGAALKASRPILVSRENPRQDLKDVLEQGAEFLREGRSVLLFPQSTRTVGFNPAGFNSLGVKLAQKAGATVTPIALLTDIAPPGRISWLRDFGAVDLSREVRFACGPDLPADAKCLDAARAFISETMASWNG